MTIALTNAGWQLWQNLGGPAIGSVAAGLLDNGVVEVFARGTAGELMARRQTFADRWT